MTDEIRPIEPKGLEMIPTKTEIPDPQPVDVPNAPTIDDSVSTINLILLWMKEHLVSYILSAKSGNPIASPLSSAWFYSITFLAGIIVALLLVHIF